MTNHSKLINLLLVLRTFLARPDNDFTWSSWESADVALCEIDSFISAAKSGCMPTLDLLLAPTGPAQEVSLSSGWGNEFLALANEIEVAVKHT